MKPTKRNKTLSVFAGATARLAVMLAALAFTNMSAHAALIVNVNFDSIVTTRTDLVGPAGGSGETWNQTMIGTHGATGRSNTNVLDSAGNTTAIDWALNRADNGGLFNWNGSENASLSMLKHGIFTNSGVTHTLTLTELDPAKTYDLYIAGYATGYANQVSFATTHTSTTPNPQTLTNSGESASWVLNDNYVVFEDMVPDGSGTLTVNMTKVSDYGFWSGFQLVETVPEPSCALLGGLGLLALLRRRR